MDVLQINEYARALHAAHGGKAEAEAAQKAREKEEAGELEEAKDWRAIQRVLSGMRGPSLS